ncbi:UNVERIFIED_CONTAM: hypothetical protein Scaly_2349700 [Sesamum calycinum]|uniref:Uncharacterized protein n=1 Tax=Sesamum calycinum TaxID=2727403 RepID=A0AAW2M050_9LAMI
MSSTAPQDPPPTAPTSTPPCFHLLAPTPPGLSPHHTPSPSLLYHCIASLHRQDGTIFSIAAAKGLVFTGSESSRIRAWRQPDCTERGYFRATCGEVRTILAHGNTLFTSHKDCKVRIWNITAATENFQAKKDRGIERLECGGSPTIDALTRLRPRRQHKRGGGEPGRRLCLHVLLRRLRENLEKGIRAELAHTNNDAQIPAVSRERIGLKLIHELMLPLLGFFGWIHQFLGEGKNVRKIQSWRVLTGAQIRSSLSRCDRETGVQRIRGHNDQGVEKRGREDTPRTRTRRAAWNL